jgi:hypothetical protein
MVHLLTDLPHNIVGFKAVGEVTENDFKVTVLPNVQKLIDKTDSLNYLLVLDTSIKNFTAAAWWQDAILGVKHLTKWKRAAIVSDVEAIRVFTNIFSVLIPGEFKGFKHEELQEAIDWVAEKTD